MPNLKKNFLYNTIYQLLLIILPLITAPYVARVLGASNLGIYSYTYSVAYYFLLLAKLGIDNYGSRTIARVRDDREKFLSTFWSLFFLQMLLAVIAIIFYFLYITFINHQYNVIFLIQSLWVIGALFDINWLFYGLERFKIIVTRNSILKFISFFLIIFCVKTRQDLWVYTLIMAGSSLSGFIVIWPIFLKDTRLVIPKPKLVFSHLKPLFVLFIPVIAISFFTLFNKIILKGIAGTTQVGFYEAAEKIVIAPKGIISALGMVMLPRISSLGFTTAEMKQKKKYIDFSIIFSLILSFPCAFGLISVNYPLTVHLFGVPFRSSAILLAGLAITLPLYAWGNVVRSLILLPSENDRPYGVSVVLGAVVNIGTNLVLIPSLGALGAVVASILSEATLSIYQTLATRRSINYSPYFKIILWLLFISLVMLMSVYALGHLGSSIAILLLQIVAGGAVFVTLLYAYLRFSKDKMIIAFRIELQKMLPIKVF